MVHFVDSKLSVANQVQLILKYQLCSRVPWKSPPMFSFVFPRKRDTSVIKDKGFLLKLLRPSIYQYNLIRLLHRLGISKWLPLLIKLKFNNSVSLLRAHQSEKVLPQIRKTPETYKVETLKNSILC